MATPTKPMTPAEMVRGARVRFTPFGMVFDHEMFGANIEPDGTLDDIDPSPEIDDPNPLWELVPAEARAVLDAIETLRGWHVSETADTDAHLFKFWHDDDRWMWFRKGICTSRSMGTDRAWKAAKALLHHGLTASEIAEQVETYDDGGPLMQQRRRTEHGSTIP